MKALVTGLNGTVAPFLARALSAAGHIVIPWNRSVVPIDDRDAARDFIRREHPDWFFHVATGSPAWAELAAGVCSREEIRFLFTSSVSVFSASQCGPFTVDILPKPDDDYGRYKLECEQRVRAARHDAVIVRLGWQIGATPGGNQMVDYLDRTFKTLGQIDASVHWYPACSFLSDTARSLMHMMQNFPPGLYHLDGNPGLSFYEIAAGLNRIHGEPWIVNPGTTPVQNSRMIDQRVQVGSISEILQSAGRPESS